MSGDHEGTAGDCFIMRCPGAVTGVCWGFDLVWEGYRFGRLTLRGGIILFVFTSVVAE